MGNLSSVNFKKISNIKQSNEQLKHNTTKRPDYKIKDENQKYNMDFESASKYRDEIIETARLNYEKKYKQKFQAKSYLWHCVINIKEDSTMDDVKKFVDYLESEFKFKVFQYAIHRDEGHIENGKEIINHHAHIELCSLDVETGINLWKRSTPNEKDIHKKAMTTNTMRKIQTETAKILGMERGKDKRETGVKRIEPRKYGALKEKEKKEIQMLKKENEKKLKSKDKQWLRKFVYSTFEDTRKSMIEENKNARLLCNDENEESMILYDKDDYKALRDEKAYIEMLIENCENPEDIEIQTDIMLLAMKKIEEVREKARAQAKNKTLTQEQLNIQIAQIQQSYNDKLKAKDDELKAKDEEIDKLEKALEPISTYTEPLLDNIIDIYTKSPADAELYIRKLAHDRNQDFINYRQWKNELKEELEKKYNTNKEPTSQNNSDDEENRIIDLEKENEQLKANLKTLNDNFKGYVSKVDIILEYIFEKFKISNIVELAFNWKKSQELNQAPQSAEPSQEIQLTPKADIQRNTSNQNKANRGRM